MTPSRDDCRSENCTNADQQFSRILCRWRMEPFAFFDDDKSNYQALRLATDFLIGRILKRGTDQLLHEYWCDGTDFVHTTSSATQYYLGGACVFSDRNANAMWLAPFELSLQYADADLETPRSLSLRLGHRDAEHPISMHYPTGRKYQLYAVADAIFGDRPLVDDGWATVIELDPYRKE